ncbi:MAG: hypothetical protein RSG96_08185, partial [Clostridia bacterium]
MKKVITRTDFEQYRQRIGYLPQDVGFHAKLTVYQTLDYYSILQKLGTKYVRYIGGRASPEDAAEEPTVEDAYLLARNPGLRG